MTPEENIQNLHVDERLVTAELVFVDSIKVVEVGDKGKKRRRRLDFNSRPVMIRIDNGDFGIITAGRPLIDPDGLEETYLEGEAVILEEYDIDGKLEITQLRTEPGFVHINITQEIVGLSLDQSDLATFEMVMKIALEEPRRLLTFVSDHRYKEANPALTSKVIAAIQGKASEMLQTNLHLWSSPDFREVADVFAQELDRLLSVYGLRTKAEYFDGPDVKSHYAKRKYPAALPDLITEYEIAERILIKQLENSPVGVGSLGLTAQDISEVRMFSKHRGEGAGLFELSTKDLNRIQAYIDWMNGISTPPFVTIRYLKALEEAGTSNRSYELSRQIILSAFSHPILGIGEWANSEYDAEQSVLLKMMMRLEQGAKAE